MRHPLRVALIGSGRIACALEKDERRYKPCTHLGALRYLIQQGEKAALSDVCDIRPEAFGNIPEFFQGYKKHYDWRDLIETDPELLIVASDTRTHFDILSSAIRRGIPRVVVEKPVCMSVKEAKRLRTLAQKNETRLFVNYERRYHPKYIGLREKLKEESIVSYRALMVIPARGFFPVKSSEGALLHDTTHLVDLCQFLFGDVRKSQAKLISKHEHLLELHHFDCAGSVETVLHPKLFHLEIEILTEANRYRVGNGFFQVEPIRESKLYAGFFSLNDAESTSEAALPPEQNPFVRLYRDVFAGNLTSKNFLDACENVILLKRRKTY